MASKKSNQEEQRAGAEIVYGTKECYVHKVQLLTKLGFPKGVLPLHDIEEYGLVEETGFVWMKLKAPYEHFFKSTKTLVKYDTEFTAYVEKGKMQKVSGVKCKHFLMWVPIVDMSIEDVAPRQIYFKSSMGYGKSFPITAFMDDAEKQSYLEKINA